MVNERIGRIESIDGHAKVEHADGSNEVLHGDSQLYLDDIVSTGRGAHLSVRLFDGSVIELGSEQSQKLDSEITDAGGVQTAALDAGTAIDAISGIGILTRADGEVLVTRDGESISLRVGDSIYSGDIIKTGASGSATFTMADGSGMSLGPDFVADLNDVFFPGTYAKYLESGLDEAASIQAAIRAGRDPSEDAPAPGAGELRSSEGGEAVILQASTRAVTPESGHETHGQELPFRIPEDELLLQTQQPQQPQQNIQFSLSADTGSVSEESGGVVTYTLSYTGGALTGTNQATVDLGIVDDGDGVVAATDGVDYVQALLSAVDAGLAGTGITRSGNTLTFAAGSDTGFTFSLGAVDDDQVEGVEDIVLGLSGAGITSGTAGVASGSDAVNVDIVEQDAAVTFSLVADTGSVSEESGGVVTYTLSYTGGALTGTNQATVDLGIVDDGDGVVAATDGVDYVQALLSAVDAGLAGTGITRSGNTLTFAAGSDTGFTFSLVAVDDDQVEGVEDIVLGLSGAGITSGTAGVASGSDAVNVDIVEQDAAVTFSLVADTGSVSEESGGVVTYTLSYTGGALTGTNQATVDLGIVDDGDGVVAATDGVDYVQALLSAVDAGLAGTGITRSGNTLTFAAGSDTGFTFSLGAVDDDQVEGVEDIVLGLSGAGITSGTAGVASGSDAVNVDIVEQDAAVTFSLVADTGSVSEESGGVVTYTLSYTGGALTGTNQATVDLGIVDDGDGVVAATDGVDYVQALLSAVDAGLAGTGITRSGNTLTFAAGSDTGFTFSLGAVDDDQVEGVEDIVLGLSGAGITSGTAGVASGSDAVNVDIVEQDAAVTFSLVADTGSVSEESGGVVTYTLSYTGGALTGTNQATVDLGIVDDGDGVVAATDGVDYVQALLSAVDAGLAGTGITRSGNTLTFAAGSDTGFTFSLGAVDDDQVEGVEDIVLGLSGAGITSGTAGVASGSDAVNVDIVEQDAAVTFSLVADTGSVSEESGGVVTYTLSYTGGALTGTNQATVDLGIVDDGDGVVAATDGVDYVQALLSAVDAGLAGTGITRSGNTLTFAAGSDTGFTFSLVAVDDDQVEGVEDIVLGLSGAGITSGTAGVASGSDAVNVDIVEQDAAVTFSLVADTGSVSEESGGVVTYTLSYTGGALTGTNQATVDLGIVDDGDGVVAATDGVDYVQALLSAVDAGLAGTGITRSGNTLTFAAGSDTGFTFSLGAVDDDQVEGVEDIVLGLSGAGITSGTAGVASGSDAVNVDIVEQDVEVFPTGLAYTVAGSKLVSGEQLYGIDLETGQTTRVGEVQVNGTSLNPNAVGGMSLNPVDGYLYAVASSGNDSYLIKINPATAETVVIDSTNSFTKATAATHGIDGTLYLSFGNKIFIYDLANPGTSSSLTLIAQGAKSLAIDAIAINNTGDTMYLANGDELWSVNVAPGGGLGSPVLIGQVAETIGSATTAYTLDGMSFDDNGVLWGLDNSGNILRIDIADASAENVTTISNSDVRGGGTDSLAISNVDPGAYVVFSDASTTDSGGLTVQDHADSYTQYIPSDEVSTSFILNETDLDIGSVTAANVDITTGPNGEISVTNLSPSDVDNVYIKADTDKTITVDGFNSVDVTTRGEHNSNITITDAERGVIDTGEGKDHVTIITDPLAGDGGSDETFVIKTDGGDDVITLSPGALANADFVINSGEHMDGSETALDFDILRIDDDIDLGAANLVISNLEGIDVTGSGNNLVQLSAQDVLDMTDGNNILRVDGDMTDAVQALDTGWVQGTDQMINSVNYHTFTSSGVSLLVNEDMQLLGGINIP